MKYQWIAYGIHPCSGEFWRVTDQDGLDAIPRDGMMLVYQPNTGESRKRHGDWFLFRSDKGFWIEATDSFSALQKHVFFPSITCTRQAYYCTSEEWAAFTDKVNAEIMTFREE